MLRIAFVCVLISGFANCAVGQSNAGTHALESPVRMEPVAYAAVEVLGCSVGLPPSASLFGLDVDHTTKQLGASELFSPFRVFAFDEDCSSISTWTTTGVVGSTVTGLAYDGSTYFVCDLGSGLLTEYTRGTGIATGNVVPTPAGGSVWGSMVIDDNQAGSVLCINDLALDEISCIDLDAGGAFLCRYSNPDNSGIGAFGSGTADAVAPSECSGQTLVNTSGTVTEGRVTRAGQYDCTGADPSCTDRWDLGLLEPSFINGIAEVERISGDRSLFCADNSTSTVWRVDGPLPEPGCQDIDPDMSVLFVNGSQGGAAFTVEVDTAGTLTVGVQRTPAGNGRFVHQLHSGMPSVSSIRTLFDLGTSCFPFLEGGAVVVESNVGRTHLVGTSSYFGAPIPNPAKAPTFLDSMLQPSIDAVNLSAGSAFTHQLIALNPAASSTKGASLSNAVVMVMQ